MLYKKVFEFFWWLLHCKIYYFSHFSLQNKSLIVSFTIFLSQVITGCLIFKRRNNDSDCKKKKFVQLAQSQHPTSWCWRDWQFWFSRSRRWPQSVSITGVTPDSHRDLVLFAIELVEWHTIPNNTNKTKRKYCIKYKYFVQCIRLKRVHTLTSTSVSERPVSAASNTTSAVWGALGHLLNCCCRTASWSTVKRITRISSAPLEEYRVKEDLNMFSLGTDINYK